MFDLDTTLSSIELSSLFDMFGPDGQTVGDVSAIDESLMDHRVNDTLFGFMDSSPLLEGAEWYQ